jgi:hypothetical protein
MKKHKKYKFKKSGGENTWADDEESEKDFLQMMSCSDDVPLNEQIEPTSYYRENVFSLEDLYLYRGVMNFYSYNYEQAVLVRR